MHESYDDWLRIAFIGGGEMGEAILSSLLASGLSQPQDIYVSDISENRREYIKQKYGVTVMGDNRLAQVRGDLVILAVEPDSMAEVMNELRGRFEPYQLVLSVVEGIATDTLSSGLAYNHIARAVISTADQSGERRSVWTTTPQVSYEQQRWAGFVLGAMGEEVHVADEKLLDGVVVSPGKDWRTAVRQ